MGQGKTVLVDVTADWCINCQVNKALVLDRGWVAEQLAAGKIIGLKADWTRPDPAIARYLASFGRYGIPFNAVYGPRAQQGLPLPTRAERKRHQGSGRPGRRQLRSGAESPRRACDNCAMQPSILGD